MNGLRVGIAGLGTVGAGVLKILERHEDMLARRGGRSIDVTAVSARDRRRNRGVDISRATWFDDPVALARDDEVDVVVELIGGADGVAKAVAEAAIARGKPFVTANKALIAHHGTALARSAEATGATLHFEAAVAGGIPIVKAIRDGLSANRIERIYGILNGTCNYILTRMERSGQSFDAVLKEAQAAGYAEAEPSMDIDGIDTAHKLSILSALAFGAAIRLDSVALEGIRHVDILDIRFAHRLGFKIKLLGIARMTEEGVDQRVHPSMVPIESPIAHVDGAFNAIVAEGDFVGRTVFEGAGAGEGPSASAVVADLVDVARGMNVVPFGVSSGDLSDFRMVPKEHYCCRYYVRLEVLDRPGVMAGIAGAFRDFKVSLESIIQDGKADRPDRGVPVVLVTHEADELAMKGALARIAEGEYVLEDPVMIRIEGF